MEHVDQLAIGVLLQEGGFGRNRQFSALREAAGQRAGSIKIDKMDTGLFESILDLHTRLVSRCEADSRQIRGARRGVSTKSSKAVSSSNATRNMKRLLQPFVPRTAETINFYCIFFGGLGQNPRHSLAAHELASSFISAPNPSSTSRLRSSTCSAGPGY